MESSSKTVLRTRFDLSSLCFGWAIAYICLSSGFGPTAPQKSFQSI